jgi:V8-like Glu-specific endopeptidase
MGVMPANAVKLSREMHHLLYTSNTWPGDSGGALVMYNGELVALHLAGVNALKEQLERKRGLQERISAVEESLESAARSMANGCIALLAHVFAGQLGV